MHVNAKTAAFGGLMLAFTEVCIVLGSIIETNTLFLLAAASYLVGIVIREMGMKAGTAFYFAGILLGILIAPNKFYVFSYAALGLYVLLIEVAWNAVGKMSQEFQNKKVLFWISKILIFNVIYVAIMLGGWDALFTKKMTWQVLLGFIAAGQIGFFIYDKAYEYVQGQIWTKMRGRLLN